MFARNALNMIGIVSSTSLLIISFTLKISKQVDQHPQDGRGGCSPAVMASDNPCNSLDYPTCLLDNGLTRVSIRDESMSLSLRRSRRAVPPGVVSKITTPSIMTIPVSLDL
ncbi:hypothetical protein H4Q26_010614 [Puccinia striiformis f. sp. tritici PST-130]|nr:hypothetical protein H4Q26_010614 [Puccinia striiformis f. sp. tritici PST-130]